MSSMPGWAYALLAPFAADKFVAEPLKGLVGTYDAFKERNQAADDLAQYKRDLALMESNPNAMHRVDLMAYNNPSKAFEADAKIKSMVDDRYKTAATAPLNEFTTKYGQLAGTGSSFYTDPESRAMLEAQGLPKLDTKNPYIASGLDSYLNKSQGTADLTKLAENPANPDPATLARVSMGDKGDTHLKSLLDQFKYADEVT